MPQMGTVVVSAFGGLNGWRSQLPMLRTSSRGSPTRLVQYHPLIDGGAESLPSNTASGSSSRRGAATAGAGQGTKGVDE